MRFVEYTPLALRTESQRPYGSEQAKMAHRCVHAALGICSEYSELKDDSSPEVINYLEELGDVVWYLNLGCDAIGISLDEIGFNDIADYGYDFEVDFECIEQLGIYAGHFADKAKRLEFYLADIDAVQKDHTTLRDNIVDLLEKMKHGFLYACDQFAIDPEDVMDRNIEKLKARYPDKFTTEHALNRDLEKEKKALNGDEDLNEPLGEQQTNCSGEACESCQ